MGFIIEINADYKLRISSIYFILIIGKRKEKMLRCILTSDQSIHRDEVLKVVLSLSPLKLGRSTTTVQPAITGWDPTKRCSSHHRISPTKSNDWPCRLSIGLRFNLLTTRHHRLLVLGLTYRIKSLLPMTYRIQVICKI